MKMNRNHYCVIMTETIFYGKSLHNFRIVLHFLYDLHFALRQETTNEFMPEFTLVFVKVHDSLAVFKQYTESYLIVS